MVEKYTAPTIDATGYHCPHCQVFAHQSWGALLHDIDGHYAQLGWYRVGRCARCKNMSVWYRGTLVVPAESLAPPPTDDMPDDVKNDYDEARSVLSKSPRSSSALLRLAVQKLCVDLGGTGKNLNEDIGTLVKNGLPVQVQQAFDVLRVIGNNQVHPGVLDVRDEPETASALFGLLNMIVEVMITRPKQVEALFNKLPAEAQQQIQKRDAGKP
ncbi:MAG TPA: DUF4145 domain-containing protein [Candidatus Angelobacter sp.]|jgi:hypothetical protein